jgi:anti-sigma factor RsiW
MAYLDGELAADRSATVAAHFEGCAECRALVGDLQAVSRRMAEWEVEGCGLAPVEGTVVRRWRWKLLLAPGVVTAAVLVFGVWVRIQTRPAPVSFTAVMTKPPLAVYPSQEVRPTLRPEGFTEQTGDTTLTFVGPMIARAAQLTLIATDFSHARERMEAILKSHHGYVGQLTASSPTGAGRSLDAALRVPSAELDATMTELKKLGRADSESQSGEEVTQQYVDLEARLANAHNAEQRLSAVLRERTGKMQDVLDVEKEITRIRGEIEQMEASRKALAGRVEFATINLKINEEYKAQLQAPDSAGTRLGNAAVAGFRHVADGAMSLAEFTLEYGLTLATWMAIVFWPARWVWKRYGTRVDVG